MTSLNLSNVYVADGFAEDCELMLQHYLNLNTTSYKVFCEVWKELNFAQIFCGASCIAEVAELSEEVLIIAKQIMVQPGNSFERSVCGLYILYGMVHLQPFKNFAPVRFIPEDVEAILAIKREAKKRNTLDVLYILGSLLINGPREYHISQRPYGMEKSVWKYYEDLISIEKFNVNLGVLHESHNELEALREISTICNKYIASRDAVSSYSNLNYVNKDIGQELENSLKKVIKLDRDIDTESPDKEKSPSPTAWSIKKKAMKNTVAQMKHLVSVQTNDTEDQDSRAKARLSLQGTGEINSAEENETTSTSPNKSLYSSINSPTLKEMIRIRSPRKPVHTCSPKNKFRCLSNLTKKGKSNKDETLTSPQGNHETMLLEKPESVSPNISLNNSINSPIHTEILKVRSPRKPVPTGSPKKREMNNVETVTSQQETHETMPSEERETTSVSPNKGLNSPIHKKMLEIESSPGKVVSMGSPKELLLTLAQKPEMNKVETVISPQETHETIAPEEPETTSVSPNKRLNSILSPKVDKILKIRTSPRKRIPMGSPKDRPSLTKKRKIIKNETVTSTSPEEPETTSVTSNKILKNIHSPKVDKTLAIRTSPRKQVPTSSPKKKPRLTKKRKTFKNETLTSQQGTYENMPPEEPETLSPLKKKKFIKHVHSPKLDNTTKLRTSPRKPVPKKRF